jgi:hypothetical protein
VDVGNTMVSVRDIDICTYWKFDLGMRRLAIAAKK